MAADKAKFTLVTAVLTFLPKIQTVSTARICRTGMLFNLIKIYYVIAKNVFEKVNAEYQITTNSVQCKYL